MDIEALKTVLRVKAHQSIAGAARELGVDPSSVSRTVAAVEADLGLRLFHRTTRKLSVTDEGQRLLTRLAPLVEEFDAAREDARGIRGRPSGVLRMTASVAFANQILVPMLPAFHAQFPDITVELRASDQNLDLVAEGVDLAIRLAAAPKGDLVSSRLMHTHYRLVASPGYVSTHPPIASPKDLEHHNCLRFAISGLKDVWRFRQTGQVPFDVNVGGQLLMSNALNLLTAARHGIGIAMLADWMVRDDLENGNLIALCSDHDCTLSEFDTAAWLLYPDRSYLPQKVRVMIDFLRQTMRAARA